MNTRPIILTGFMATGKTTIGKALAHRLGWRFIDTDEEVEKLAGKPIAHIFADEGEWWFRALENRVCQSLLESSSCVIATGGGTLLYAQNRDYLHKTGTIICLQASFEVIYNRLLTSKYRPLARAKTRRELLFLHNERSYVYNAIPNHIRSDVGSLSTIVENIVEKFCNPRQVKEQQITHIATAFTGAYPITQGMPDMWATDSFYIADPVLKHHVDVSKSGIWLSLTEQHKNLSTVQMLYETLLSKGLTREHRLVAIGGGALLDVVGFVAATFLRGIGLINVPSTLLAMVDAGFGGKTGVDFAGGKNLIGAFYPPQAVYINPSFLNTLPARMLACGMAEIIKHALLDEGDLWDLLHQKAPLETLIPKAILIKARIVEEDPYERSDRRMLLNLGHTFGHAFEQASGYQIPHGEAVGVGLLAAANLGVLLSKTSINLLNSINKLLNLYGLPTRLEGLLVADVMQALAQDKKRGLNSMRFIVPTDRGKAVVVENIPTSLVAQSLTNLI